MTLISESEVTLQPKITHVIPADKLSTDKLRVLPLVSVQVNPVELEDQIYARIFEGSTVEANLKYGDMTYISFSAHVHTSACNDAGADKGKYAQDLADKIIDRLLEQAKNQNAYGISDIFELSHGEAEPAGWQLARVVINGKIQCKRYEE